MTSRLVFRITCERCGKTDCEPAYFENAVYGNDADGKFGVVKVEQVPMEEARENADITFLMKGWAVADFGKTKKGKVDLCPDCVKQWEELGMEDYDLVPDEDSKKTGYMLEFRYKGEKKG